MTEDRSVILNRLAQGIVPLSEGSSWFNDLPEALRRDVLRELASYFGQAHATVADVEQGLTPAGVKPTHTPAVLLLRGTLHVQLARLAQLPLSELEKSFRLLVCVLGGIRPSTSSRQMLKRLRALVAPPLTSSSTPHDAPVR